MKIQCLCGEILHDATDGLPNKAHFIPDQKWHGMFESLDWLIENRCDSPRQRDEACNHLRQLMNSLSRTAWQCRSCGRMYLEDETRDLHCYSPGTPGTTAELFRESPA